MGKNVQFHDVESVVDFYTDNELTCWAVFDGTAINCRYNGDDLDEGATKLRNWLESVRQSSATYTLKIFSDVKEKITHKTDADLATNFRLNNVEINGALYGGYSNMSVQMLSELKDLKRQLTEQQATIDELEIENELYVNKINGLETKQTGLNDILMKNLEPLLQRVGANLGDLIFPPRATALGMPAPSGAQDLQSAVENFVHVIPAPYSATQVLNKLYELGRNDPARFKQYLELLINL